MAKRTLAQINEGAESRRREWNDKYLLEPRAAVGAVGFRRSGEKNHYLSTEVVVGYLNGFEPTFRQFKIGQVFSAYGRCNGNGQNVAKVDPRLDTDAINCKKCGG